VNQHRSVDFAQYVVANLNDVVRPHTHDVGVESGVVKLAERDAI
jgi:hypothetical protein